MRYTRTLPAPQSRRGFTLIEIMVVIIIIVILVSLTAASYFYFIGGQQGHNTEGTIRTTYKVFQGQWNWVVEQAKKESPSSYVLNNVANGNPQVAQEVWIKIRLVEAFPISYDEVNNPNNPVYVVLNLCIPPAPQGQPQRKSWDSYRKYLGVNRTSPVSGPAPSESSACLLMALSVSRGGRSLSPDEIRGFVADTDNDGVNEIVDGWRSPLVFYRFAWGSGALPGNPGAPNGILGLNPAPANSKTANLADPLDPGGLLLTWQGAGRTAFEGYAHRIAVGGPGTTQPPTFYVIPVIMSLGPDQDMVQGVLQPSLPSPTQCATMGLTVQTAATATDNIYSFNLR